MAAAGETLMCAGCMDIVTLIHDETTIADPMVSKVVIEAVRMSFFAAKKVHITDEELGTFLLVLGGSLLVWESNNG